MNPDTLKQRSKEFALRVIRMSRTLRRRLRRRLSRINSFAAPPPLLQTIELVVLHVRVLNSSPRWVLLEEADESLFWIEMLADAEIVPQKRLTELRTEAAELAAIFAASRLTAGKN